MRFIADGPSIPHELLIARDEGRVVFFCGAGVSRARAGLADFLGLAKEVADKLAIRGDSPARKLIQAIETFPTIAGMGSPISADRIFSLIEREVRSRDIYRAICHSLKPDGAVDLTAHKILLDLSRGADGSPRLITTNFDLLFEACNQRVQRWSAPRLPDPLRAEEFKGVIHLHGHVTNDYTDAAGDGLVISSAEFGQAYLSEQWATKFIRGVLEKFLVVFVGYSADDPPMQYLLEALNRTVGTISGVYAFQSGTIEDAQARWSQKGVQPIAYEPANDHTALWSTLGAWADRARNSERWYTRTIARARKGPERLTFHERGQVAHIVSTVEGARKFAELKPPCAASWLCAFDPSVRFRAPGRVGFLTEEREYFDPFASYGIDSDTVPAAPDPDDNSSKREVPRDAWNCFSLTRRDREGLREDQYSGLRGHWSVNLPRLPARLDVIGHWISQVAIQPAAVWWAANQVGLHPDIQQRIKISIQKNSTGASKVVRKAWRLIFEAWATQGQEFYPDWFALSAHVKAEGWSRAAIREAGKVQRPYLKVQQPFSFSRPPQPGARPALRDLVHVDVEYPDDHGEIKVPDKFLPQFLNELRKNLELGVALEQEIGGYGLRFNYAIEANSDPESDGSRLVSGISKPALKFARLFKRLAELDPLAAKSEAATWQRNSDPIFSRMVVWAASDVRIFTTEEAAAAVHNLSQREFWSSENQRDLLLTLAKRWPEFTIRNRTRIERRLLSGRPAWSGEAKDEYVARRASLSLTRIHWLASQGCQFTFEIAEKTEVLKKQAPEWNAQYAVHAADSMESRVDWVRTDTDSSGLEREPLNSIMTKATELSRRNREAFVERDPFAGLVATKPVRAFLALVGEGRRGSYPGWAWRTFLNAQQRKTDKARFVVAIGKRLSGFVGADSKELVRAASDWLLKVSETLFVQRRSIFETLWNALVANLRNQEFESVIISEGYKEPDWATEALNSPVGHLAQALINDPETKNLAQGGGLPAWWRTRAEELLSLPSPLHRHAIVMLRACLESS